MASRRGLLQGAVLLVGVWAVMARPWNWIGAPSLKFEPLDGRAPFRRLRAGGDISGGGAGGAVLIGLDAPEPTDPALDARLRNDLTGVLWGDWTGGAPVPVTYFTDIRCPICRVLESRLDALDGIVLTTREFPVFGEVSEQAARAILAAGLQNSAEAMRQRLHRAPAALPDDVLADLAEGLRLDRARFTADLGSDAVHARLAEDRALARIFQLPGTPALIVGRTRVVGLQPGAVLDALVAHETAGAD